MSPPTPPNPHVEALTPNKTVFGDEAFNKVIKVKRSHECEDLAWQGRCPYKEESPEFVLSTHTHREKATWGHSEKVPSANQGERPT